MKVLIIILSILTVLVFLVWLGLQIPPAPFSKLPESSELSGTTSMPDSLPSAAKRFFGNLYDDKIPIAKTAVVAGRAKMRITGITFPARFRFSYSTGAGYRHEMELCFFGFPVMKADEIYSDGQAVLRLPFGTVENEPKVNQGANLALWGESLWLPSVLITHPDVEWVEMDTVTSLLKVPYLNSTQHFVIRFNEESGLPTMMEAMRYREADDEEKMLWLIESQEWKTINGTPTFTGARVTWFDEGSPWAIFKVEDIQYNIPVELD